MDNKQLRCKIFTIRYASELGNFDDVALCKFVDSHQVVEITKKFSRWQGEPYWTAFVTYVSADKISPEKKSAESETALLEKLTPEEQELYGILRKWRNELAKEKGYGPYILFTNAQLAQIAKDKPATLQKLGTIHGVGDGKLENYGKTVLATIQEFCNKKQQP